MFSCKRLLPLFLFLVCLGGGSQAHAQLSMPAYTTTYCVQVQWEMWRSGGTYWATEYETDNLEDAQLVHALFVAAFENGTLCDILGCSFDWIPVDVRMTTRREWNLYPVDPIEPVFGTARFRTD